MRADNFTIHEIRNPVWPAEDGRTLVTELFGDPALVDDPYIADLPIQVGDPMGILVPSLDLPYVVVLAATFDFETTDAELIPLVGVFLTGPSGNETFIGFWGIVAAPVPGVDDELPFDAATRDLFNQWPITFLEAGEFTLSLERFGKVDPESPPHTHEQWRTNFVEVLASRQLEGMLA